ncbi:MAG: glycosyltransferase [Gammaproteobacteria bacterium]
MLAFQLTLLVPCYNEEAALPHTLQALLEKLDSLQAQGKIRSDSQLYCIDDGSNDRSWAIIQAHAAQDPRIHALKLSRNFGHQAALLAGLLHAQGDALISIDADHAR